MPRFERGDYVKVEFEGQQGLPGEWMWVRVVRCDEKNKLVFGTLDNDSVLDENLKVGQELAIVYDKVREHRKPWEFNRQ